jgi:hypoxanthine phosphoribosyltransferase|tara:strand:+ start:1776 stop:2183 length:408 start_codon:yes stop_codon:yes gene_type:complete
MTNKVFISWKEYEEHIDSIVNWAESSRLKLGAVYGLPRGGLPIAVSLSHRLHLPLLMNYFDRKIVTDDFILVVDDIADTGHTLKDFENSHNVICTFHYHKQSIIEPEYWVTEKGDDWIVYPWERDDSDEIQDYLT